MPIGTNSANNFMSVNGEPSKTDSLLLNSLDDDESFVVVQTERSTGLQNDRPTSDLVTSPPESQATINSLSYQNDCSFPVFNNMTRSGMSTSRMLNESQMFSAHDVPTVDHLGFRFDSQTVSVSPEAIQKQLQDVLRENMNLKDNLYQTNLAMKQQLGTVALLQDRALEVQRNHTAKFEEVKDLILKLTSEKNALLESFEEANAQLTKKVEECKELKEANVAFGSEVSRILAENDSLKKQLSSSQEALQALQSASEHNKMAPSQPTAKEVELHSLVDQLSRKLETVERAHRHQGFDLERVQAQLARAVDQVNQLQQELALKQAPPPAEETRTEDVNSNPSNYIEKTSKYNALLLKLKAFFEEEKARNNSMNSWISMSADKNSAQIEITELRRLLGEEQSQSVARKENLYYAVSTIHELLNDYQKLGEELERVKADHALKESHSAVYDEMQKKGFTERIDSLTASLVEKEESLAVSQRHLASLQEAVRLQNEVKKGSEEVSTLKEQVDVLTKEAVSKDEQLQAKVQEANTHQAEVARLQDELMVRTEQADIYKSDFEAERRAREALVAEKDRLMEDLRHLQRRNQDLIDERVANPPPPSPTTATQAPQRPRQTPSPPPPRPQDEPVPPPKRFFCPNPECNMAFPSVAPLQLHVIQCLNLDD